MELYVLPTGIPPAYLSVVDGRDPLLTLLVAATLFVLGTLTWLVTRTQAHPALRSGPSAPARRRRVRPDRPLEFPIRVPGQTAPAPR